MLPRLPARPDDGHKGTFGSVLVVGGSADMLGAPMLAARAAYRVGAGYVRVALPRAMLAAALTTLPEVVGVGLDEKRAEEQLAKAAEQSDVLALGPGLGQQPDAAARVRQLVALDKLAVVDADALNLIAAEGAWPAAAFKARAVLTPHPGEMRRLAPLAGLSGDVPTDDAGRLRYARTAAERFGQVVVLKGRFTVIASPDDRHARNETGGPQLAKAGTGDVLTGTVAGLMAQGLTPFDAAVLGAWLHGRAGVIAGERVGPRSVLAHEVADALAAALAERA